MKCPACGNAEMTRDTRDISYTYKGETLSIQAVTGEFCPDCQEAVLDWEDSVRASHAMVDFNKKDNASIVDPAFIVTVRKKLA